jgi:hypothetical protein
MDKYSNKIKQRIIEIVTTTCKLDPNLHGSVQRFIHLNSLKRIKITIIISNIIYTECNFLQFLSTSIIFCKLITYTLKFFSIINCHEGNYNQSI